MGDFVNTFGKILSSYIYVATWISLQVLYTLVRRSRWCKYAPCSFDAGLTACSMFGITILQVSFIWFPVCRNHILMLRIKRHTFTTCIMVTIACTSSYWWVLFMSITHFWRIGIGRSCLSCEHPNVNYVAVSDEWAYLSLLDAAQSAISECFTRMVHHASNERLVCYMNYYYLVRKL
jgi:hypothetical protein